MLGGRDRSLLAGLAVAVIVVFAQPIERYLLNLVQEAERSSGLALGPALLILTAVFVFHQQGKRQEARARALAAEADAMQAGARTAGMERLVNFGQALGRSLDLETIRDVVMQHLPTLAGTEDAWVLLRARGRWQALVGTTRETRREVERAREHVADRALVGDSTLTTEGVTAEGHFCLRLAAGGDVVGVLGLPETGGPTTEARQRVLATAGALLAISLRNAQLFHEIRETSLRDGLTGCYNRTHALEVIDTELRRARRSQLPLSLIMFDLDHFKDINDRFGHLCGDAVLAGVSSKMRDVLRGSDLKCRYGGEEFLVLLPETPLEGAKRVADSLCREIADMRVTWNDETLSITASFGVSVALPAEIDGQALIGRADAALYRAKDQGRNCVRLSIETAVA
ncbi:MAG: sensor domain-containing diguanylate cyclase [Acidobacteria bacterium]|nr:sensor domain-containing diguanylate cyclase [Acidobacteriota bacterium]